MMREAVLNLTATAVVVLCGVAGCEPATTDGTATTDATATPAATVPLCAGDVVTVDYGTYPDCDVVPPQRMDVTYPLTMDYDTLAYDCGTSGGSLVLTLPRVCMDVDY